MPLYEFDCPGCGQPFEKRLSFSANLADVACPTCGNANVKKRLSAFAVKGDSTKAAPTSNGANCAPGGT